MEKEIPKLRNLSVIEKMYLQNRNTSTQDKRNDITPVKMDSGRTQRDWTDLVHPRGPSWMPIENHCAQNNVRLHI